MSALPRRFFDTTRSGGRVVVVVAYRTPVDERADILEPIAGATSAKDDPPQLPIGRKSLHGARVDPEDRRDLIDSEQTLRRRRGGLGRSRHMDESATKEGAAGGAISQRISDPPQHPLGEVEEGTGRPLNIAVQDGAQWFRCPTSARVGRRLLVYNWPRPTIPSLMPRLLEGSAKRGRRGRPPLSESDRRRVLFTAWAIDVARAGQRQLARSLHTDATRALDVEEWARSQVRRDLAAGRIAYRELGCCLG
jgi:hypothetical protein